jgi:hypothetical protein
MGVYLDGKSAISIGFIYFDTYSIVSFVRFCSSGLVYNPLF